MSNEPRIEVFQSLNDLQWYFRVRSGNGKVVAQSEGYTRKDSAVRGARALLDITAELYDEDIVTIE